MQTNLEHELINIFKNNKKYWINDTINRTAVINDLKDYERDLINRLISNKIISKNYVMDIDGVKVLKIYELISFLRYKKYWQDSYTKYSNKIGLSTENKFLDYNDDVVLDFPYKDCVLEGGMTKEDLGKDEIFYNTIVARDEIDTLLSPKIFNNIKKYDEKENMNVSRISESDNLIIKGNNLIALSCLLEKYKGKINCIYIDPPFNTGNDSFKYNDRFNQSAWLTFMKNRLDIAKRLLSDDGNIFIHIDINQSHYLKVLCDDIFGRNNFVQEIIWSYGSASGGRSAGTKPVNIHDYIIHYSKNYSRRKAFKVYTPYSEKYINDWFKYSDDDGRIYRRRQRGKDENNNPKWERQYLDESKGVPLTTVWDDIKQVYANPQAYKKENIKSSEIELDFGNSGQKPERLIQRILEMSTETNDIVLDFFMGSGTTANTAMKMNRQVISIEQIDKQIDITINRIKDTIKGKTSGISKDINWLGGGSFVYAELMEYNKIYIDKIIKARSTKELQNVWSEMERKADLNYKIELERLKEDLFDKVSNDFTDLNLQEQKDILINSLDMNQLYVNYSEIDDEELNIPEDVKLFNKSFYGDNDE